MKIQGTACPAISFLISLIIVAYISTLYRKDIYLSVPSWYTVTVTSSPLSLSMPDENSSRTVEYLSLPETSQSQSTNEVLALPCNRDKSTEDTYLQRANGSVAVTCPVCPPSRCPGVPWYAQGNVWHFPPKFPSCTMDVCFNYSRCDNMTEPLVFTYDLPGPPQRWFQRFNESKYWTDDPEKACLFFVFLDTRSPKPVRPRDLPHWNGGLNHVLITFADMWEAKNPPGDTIGNASIMGSIVFQTTSRPGFDISLPLQGLKHLPHLQSLHPLKRKYLATFRGTRYLGHHMGGAFRSFDAFRGMHNGEDVVVATSCHHNTNNELRREHPELGVNCDEDSVLHKKYNFRDLMNTTFGLAPGGRAPTSFRLIEVMSAGAIPVLINDNYVKPFDTLIRWHECLLIFPTSQMPRIIPALRAMREEDIVKRQENCLRIYYEFLKDDDTLTETSMRALKERFMGVFPNFAHV